MRRAERGCRGRDGRRAGRVRLALGDLRYGGALVDLSGALAHEAESRRPQAPRRPPLTPS